ncbi:MAG: SELO family protein, partial [Sulfurimonas sp.]|nr:SELO family protein [Sulfurimonas sp.]
MKLKEMQLKTSYLKLDPIFYDMRSPTPLKQPYLISANPEAAKLIGLDEEELQGVDFVDFINGKHLLEGSQPFSMCYAGHQFGHFVPRLGDGRAINLGEVQGWNLQLKGAGETLYSRSGDGRAVTRSSIREYLMSEAMYALGIPTTRALALIGSQES